MNNNDNLLRDLLSTRNKGVDENSRNILNQNNPRPTNLAQPLYPTHPLDLSSRSSLLSFFQDTPNQEDRGPTILNEISILPGDSASNTPSIFTASNADSGVHSPPHSVMKVERETRAAAVTVNRRHSWRMKERVDEDDVDDVMLTMSSFETTV